MGFVKLVSPVVLGVAKKNPKAGKLAYNALAGTVQTGKKAGKALPYVGAALGAGEAYLNYQQATSKGDDPGKAAFSGIGSAALGFLGGIGGTAFGGPLGGVAGTLAGGKVGKKLGNKVWDSFVAPPDTPVPKPLTVEEQRAIRDRAQQRRSQAEGNIPASGKNYNIGGFVYSADADPTLVALRLQQQAQNIDKVQGYSRDKAAINAQLRGVLGQQYTDRYGIGQINQTERLGILQGNITERYGIGRRADVENRRTLRDERLGLGQQYTDRYTVGRQATRDERLGLGQQYTQRYGMDTERDIQNRRTDANVRLGLGQQYTERYGISRKADNERFGLDTQRQLGFGELGLRERERKDKNRQFDIDADIRRQQVNNNFGLGAMQTLAGLYR